MQGLSGFDMVQYLRAHMIDIAIVMVSSADPNQRDLARCRTIGIAPPLVKPVKTEKLLETIRHALDRQEEETPDTPLPAVVEILGRPLRILLVEDSPDNQMLILAYLKKSGHAIDLAENGEIAVEKATAGSYDLIFMDMQMPVMDGYTATRTIRAWEVRNGKTPAMPIIALTAYALKEEIEKSYGAGCTAHLTKPIKKAVLMDMIGQYAVEESRAA
jgi:CheY-like chemotaxis protein